VDPLGLVLDEGGGAEGDEEVDGLDDYCHGEVDHPTYEGAFECPLADGPVPCGVSSSFPVADVMLVHWEEARRREEE